MCNVVLDGLLYSWPWLRFWQACLLFVGAFLLALWVCRSQRSACQRCETSCAARCDLAP